MPPFARFARFRPDPFVVALLCTVVVASLLPVRGSAATGLSDVTEVAVGLLFFLYGARLSPQATLDAVRHWRLHSVVLLSTFVLFPLLGLALYPLVPVVLPVPLYTGVLFLCMLPSTVQSSIALTSTARGNVAAAIASASLSSLAGVVITPLLAGLLLSGQGASFSAKSIVDIVVQLLLPFLAGQLLRRWIVGWLERRKRVLSLFDRGSIVLIVYSAFSAGVVGGIWHQVQPQQLGALLVVEALLLGAVLSITNFASGRLGFRPEDRTAIIFCGSKKSLAAGLPMANVLFVGHSVGLAVLPLMLFHQMQLMVCAALARRLAARNTGMPGDPVPAPAEAPSSARST